MSERSIEAARRHPGRVHFSLEIEPNDVMGAVRQVGEAPRQRQTSLRSLTHPRKRWQAPIAELARRHTGGE